MKDEVLKLKSMINPLMAITDITIKKKNVGESGSFSQGIGVNHVQLSPEDRIKEMESCNPQLVLKNLVEHIFDSELSP